MVRNANQVIWFSLSCQNFKTIMELFVDAFFKHGEKDTLRSCIKAITFCSTDSQADLQDYARNKLKDLENELLVKLKSAIKQVVVCIMYPVLLLGFSRKV